MNGEAKTCAAKSSTETRDLARWREAMRYTLTLDSDQMAVLCRAAETYSRLHMLQIGHALDEVALSPEVYDRLGPGRNQTTQHVRALGDVIKSLLAPDMHMTAYYGIRSREINEAARVAWDLYQVVRHAQAWAERPLAESAMKTVSYDEPMRTSDRPLPRCEVGE